MGAPMRSSLLAIGAGAVLAACSQSSPTTGISYQTYQYTCCQAALVTSAWHPGQQVSVQWTAEAGGMTSDPTPRPVTIRATLTGPYKSVDALKQSTSQGATPPGARTIEAAPVITTDRAGANQTSVLDLPADLPPGFYNLATQVDSGGYVTGGGAVIVVGL